LSFLLRHPAWSIALDNSSRPLAGYTQATPTRSSTFFGAPSAFARLLIPRRTAKHQHLGPGSAMSTAVASAAPAPSLAPPPSEADASPKSPYTTLAPSTHTPIQLDRSSASATPNTASANAAPAIISETTAQQKLTPEGKRSPNS